MVDKHSQSFFGQSTGITIQSSSRNEPYLFFKCIQRKADGTWEKPSQGEGKTIKCNLEEIVMILGVLTKAQKSWSSYHTFQDVKTQISFQWDESNENRLWINIDKYSKMLNFAQIQIMKMLFTHILNEKIEYATTSGLSNNQRALKIKDQENSNYPKTQSNSKIIVEETIEHDKTKVNQVSGYIEGETAKALLINFPNDKKFWIPKSKIHSSYNPSNGESQSFLIDTWILEKNKVSIT